MARREAPAELAWSVAELTELLNGSADTNEFLDHVATRIARHLRADVCSIYLYDGRTRSLLLRATHGLAASAVGQVSLKLGEGITGTAVKELRTIREARGSSNPRFKFVPGTNEDEYESFLAVPIRRGTLPIGALVVQHRMPDVFVETDAQALRSVAGRLATTLENVEVFMEAGGDDGPTSMFSQSDDEPGPAIDTRLDDRFDARPVGGGIGVGRVRILSPDDTLALVDDVDPGDPQHEEARFRSALERTIRSVEDLFHELDDRLAEGAGLILGTHLLILRDQGFSERILHAIREGKSAHEAIRATTCRYVEMLAGGENPRTREKSQDLRDLGNRLLKNVTAAEDEPLDLRGVVVVAHELYPSDLVRVSAEHAEAIVLGAGGATAHIAILARSLDVPTVFVNEFDQARLVEGELVVVDATEGAIHRNPRSDLLGHVKRAKRSYLRQLAAHPRGDSRTRDGVVVKLLANVNILQDVQAAERVGATGIGLYRSEFPFLLRHDVPSEDEQFAIYRRIAQGMPEGPLVLRTLDVGGDKLFSESHHLEGNPFLGLRGVRFSLRHPDLFHEQVRAMLRAGVGRDLSILFPMVGSIDEFAEAKYRLQVAAQELDREGLARAEDPHIGAMIELPSAVQQIDAFAEEADFLSIGSNDLVMYLLAVDRGNDQVAELYRPMHPAVLAAFARIADAARNKGCPVSICGEAASLPAMLEFLVGVGITTVSADPHRIPTIRSCVEALDAEGARAFALRLLSSTTIAQVDDLLAERAG